MWMEDGFLEWKSNITFFQGRCKTGKDVLLDITKYLMLSGITIISYYWKSNDCL